MSALTSPPVPTATTVPTGPRETPRLAKPIGAERRGPGEVRAQEIPLTGRSPLELFRRVQRVGRSSASVTLPRSWTESMGVGPGSVLTFRPIGDGRLEVAVAPSSGPLGGSERVLELGLGEPEPNLLGRLLVGAYITGHERIVVRRERGFTAEERDEVARTAAKVIGMSLLEEARDRIEVQIAVDPRRHEVPRMFRRIVGMLERQSASCRRALESRDPAALAPMGLVEDEIDRVYLLVVRQLLVAVDDYRVGREIGEPVHRHQVGSRVVAKSLEMIGDLLAQVGGEVRELLALDPPAGAVDRLVEHLAGFERLLGRTTAAFASGDGAAANLVLNEIDGWLHVKRQASAESLRGVPRATVQSLRIPLERIELRIAAAAEMLVILNEITLNRFLEPDGPSEGRRQLLVSSVPEPEGWGAVPARHP